jgi:cyanophycinase
MIRAASRARAGRSPRPHEFDTTEHEARAIPRLCAGRIESMDELQRAVDDHRGHLALIGGDEDKRHDKLVLGHIVSLAPTARVAVIPTASTYPRERGEVYTRAFTGLGVAHVDVVDVRHREDGDRDDNVDLVRRADLIFFTGGDQVRLVSILHGTAVLEEVWRRFAGGATVAGTSAGAAAAGDPMIYDGDGRGLRKGAVRHGFGFGFLPGVVVDTHFMARMRVLRLAQFLSTGMARRGLGLAEDTAIVIAPGGDAEIVGRRAVTTLDAGASGRNNYHEITEDDLLTVEGMRLGFLAPGTHFDLHEWCVTRFPDRDHQTRVPLADSKEACHDRLRSE